MESGVRVGEAQHTHIHLYGRIIVQEHHHSRRKPHIHVPCTLESAGEVLAAACADFRLPAAHLQLHLVEKSETAAVAEAYVIAEDGHRRIVVGNVVKPLHGIVGVGGKHHRGIVESRAAASISELASCSQVVLEAIHQHRADLELIGVARDVLHNEKLIFILVRLGKTHAHPVIHCPLGMNEICSRPRLNSTWA